MNLRLSTLAGALAVLCAVGGCVRVDGGAVEVSWVVHADGRAITDCSCANPVIASVRIQMVGQGGAIQGLMPCAGRAQCVFGCQRQTGATPFDIPETSADEQYAISLVAMGQNGEDLPQVVTPAPILRSVVRGQPTEVDAMVLQAGCGCMMNQSNVCARL
jgi:hypothetical protein